MNTNDKNSERRAQTTSFGVTEPQPDFGKDVLSESTSGFTTDLDEVFGAADVNDKQGNFTNITEQYVSPSGHARLFAATRYGKQYMLKGLKEDFLYIPVYRQALAKEFDIGLQLEHPNICRTIGMEDIEGLGSVVIMERIDGDTLKDVIEKRALTADMAQKVAEQLADALDYMHSKQILHRDIKPSNIMITHKGHNVKLIDFSLSDSDAFAVLKQPAGSTGYMAPELYQPDAMATIESDIYSYGKVVGDMFKATHCKALIPIVKACTRRNPAERPTCKEEIFRHDGGSFPQRTILAALVVVALSLLLWVGYKIYKVNADAFAEDENNVIDNFTTGNEVLDYDHWPRKK